MLFDRGLFDRGLLTPGAFDWGLLTEEHIPGGLFRGAIVVEPNFSYSCNKLVTTIYLLH
jgi:hypothetical protein